MIKDILSKDYATLKRFCKHYKLALIALTHDGHVVEYNDMSKRLFNVPEDGLQGKNLIEFCRLLTIDCPIKTLHPTIKVNNTYHHALETDCQWHAAKAETNSDGLKWVLIGKVVRTTSLCNRMCFDNKLINELPLQVFCKNHDSTYILYNRCTEEFAGMPMTGKSDYDFAWRDNADFLIESDQIVLSDKSVLSLQALCDHNDELRQVCTFKQPIYDTSDNVVGIAGATIVYDLPQTPYNTITILHESRANLCFNVQELTYIDWLIKGKTAEEIAMILSIPKRTVESHLARIRQKACCQNQFQLGYLLAQSMQVS